ncbi:vitellin-degrading protease [Drosophila willistoni]|uniref:vitellin-degrading protease n=1 Tax=Drosophila willistoni TaxID=7260 RepID=UPI000C26CF83|nr:vitellin-degrading protease [Drosophila willistoni]
MLTPAITVVPALSLLLIICSSGFGAAQFMEIPSGVRFPYPYHVALTKNGAYICGGSFITFTVVLTAARCVIRETPDKLKIMANITALNSRYAEILNISRFLIHPKYNGISNDIALVEVHKSDAGYLVTRINMADDDAEYPENQNATFMGFGGINSKQANPLRVGYAVIWRRLYCSKEYIPGVTKKIICAGDPYKSNILCKGNTGSPLVVDGKLYGVGIYTCGVLRSPFLFTYVAPYRHWINKHLPIGFEKRIQ